MQLSFMRVEDGKLAHALWALGAVGCRLCQDSSRVDALTVQDDRLGRSLKGYCQGQRYLRETERVP